MTHRNKNKDGKLIVGFGARRQTPEIKLELDQTTQLSFDDDAENAQSDTSERPDFEYEMTLGDDIFQ